MDVTLILCYLLALASAYRVAAKLAPASWLHILGITALLFIGNLVLPAAYAGLAGQLNRVGLLVAGLALWGAEFVIAARLKPLPEPESADTRWPSRFLSRLLALLTIAIAMIVLGMVYVIAFYVPIETTVRSGDAGWHYMPNIINVVQAGSLHTFRGLNMYFPLGYEILFSWELVLARTFLLVPLLHALLYLGTILYAQLTLQLLLRDVDKTIRQIASLLLLLIFGVFVTNLRVLGETGKNDALLLMFGMVAIYYLVRYFYSPPDWRYIAFAGFACGMYMSAKLSGLSWLVGFGVVYLILVMWESRGLKRSGLWLRHILIAGSGFAVALAPWGLRLLLNLGRFSTDSEVASYGMEFTPVRQWNNPAFYGVDAVWIVLLIVSVVSAGALLFLRSRMPRLLTMGAALALWLATMLQLMSIDFDIHYGPFLTVIIFAVLTLIYAWRYPGSLPRGFAAAAAFSMAAMLSLSVVPYSAWYFELTWFDRVVININYRYSPAAYTLFVVLAMALLAHVAAQFLNKPISRLTLPAPILQPRLRIAGVSLAVAVIAASGAQLTLGDVFGMYDSYANFSARQDKPSAFFRWFVPRVHDANIYSINVPPLTLYGTGLSNTIYYATEGHDGYYGDQAYRWEDVETVVDEHDIDYIVVGFSYDEMPQAMLRPVPEVLAEIDRIRRHLQVVYEDEQITMFATRYADVAQLNTPALSLSNQ
jgi:hypothetical protein